MTEENLKGRIASLEAELAHTKEWAKRYKAERDEVVARLAGLNDRLGQLIGKYGNAGTGSENPKTN